MTTYTLQREQFLRLPIEQVFDFFADTRNLQAITPTWMDFRIRTPQPIEMGVGTLIQYTICWRGLPMNWKTRIEQWNPPHDFLDVQLTGPYAQWHHLHRFETCGAGTLMTDRVTYALPLGPIGRVMHGLVVQGDLARVFDHRFAAIEKLLSPASHPQGPTGSRHETIPPINHPPHATRVPITRQA